MMASSRSALAIRKALGVMQNVTRVAPESRGLVLRGPLPFGLQVDGDVFETPLPMELGIRPGALQILVPA